MAHSSIRSSVIITADRPEDVDAWIEASVLVPKRKDPSQLHVVPRPSDVGRLIVTPDMGRPSR